MIDDRSKLLEERTRKFSVNVILMVRKIPPDLVSSPIINQLVRAATSIGANYAEANGASSKSDFRNKIYICKKESIETRYWLKTVLDSNLGKRSDFEALMNEAHELSLIFSKIASTLNSKV